MKTIKVKFLVEKISENVEKGIVDNASVNVGVSDKVFNSIWEERGKLKNLTYITKMSDDKPFNSTIFAQEQLGSLNDLINLIRIYSRLMGEKFIKVLEITEVEQDEENQS